ncbi:MAG TPA: hypothetical protein VD966_08590 [Pyrinomonadaceae bacterium]|jgi:uncharacterized membrane protein|nr:hypothetical protein [Pyrinomonadaceae bacterium]
MEKKKQRDKYDTNPLDPDYVRQTDEVWRPPQGVAPTEDMKGATREVARSPNEEARNNIDAEAPTRRYGTPLSSSYPSVFVPPPYQPPAPTSYGTGMGMPSAKPSPPSSRTVPGINLPENVTMILPYVPFYVGAVAGIIELFLVPRSEIRTRFHAAQGLALQLTILIIGLLFNIIGNLTGSGFARTMFGLASFIFLVISIIRVWKGEEHHIAPLDEATKWLNERIEPRK